MSDITTPLIDTTTSGTAGSGGSRLLLQENVFHDSRASELVAQFNDCLEGHQHIYKMECGGVLRCIYCTKGFAQ